MASETVWVCSNCKGTEIEERVQIWRAMNGGWEEDAGASPMEYWCPNSDCEGMDLFPIKTKRDRGEPVDGSEGRLDPKVAGSIPASSTKEKT